jgi:hypothetical protein
MHIRLLVLLSVLFLVACPKPTPAPQPPPQDASDGAAPVRPPSVVDAAQPNVDAPVAIPGWATICPTAPADVVAACANAWTLKCSYAKPTPRAHEPCECRLARDKALGERNLHLACVANAKTCAEVDACSK